MIAAVALGCSILAYTGANLAVARGSGGGFRAALRSRIWWVGACLQGLGFLFVFIARGQLPLIVVQPALLLGLATTVVIGARLRWWPLTSGGRAGVVAVVCGAGLAAAVSESGPAPALSWTVVAVCTAALLVVVVAWGTPYGRSLAWFTGALSGLALGIAAILTRGLASHPDLILGDHAMLAGAVVAIAALAAGEVLLTEGLSSAHVGETLATMYVVTTAAPVLGAAILLESMPFASTGQAIVAVTGLVVACAGCIPLVEPRREAIQQL